MIRATDSQRYTAKTLLMQGMSTRQVARAIQMSHCWVYQFAREMGISLMCRRVPEASRRVLRRRLAAGETLVAAARASDTSVTTAHRTRRELLAEDGLPFQRTRTKVCQIHGTVTVWPCVACAAQEARMQSLIQLRTRMNPCG